MLNAEESWCVPADHPAFAGHFPGQPIVPGVVLLNRALRLAEAALGTPGLAWQVAQAKFLSPVGPGETLVFAVQSSPRGAILFTVRAGERAVASGSLTPLAA
ncbi:MAG TPA: hypothetical protein VFY31_02615 [Macromonas sp.]|nr:hypothetical protein [Macromonas sp.]